MKVEFNCAVQLLCGRISILMCTYVYMHGAWYADSVFAACSSAPASPGQTITTHQGKQLGMTKISLPCDCVPMFGLLEPNLTHFVHTIEEN